MNTKMLLFTLLIIFNSFLVINGYMIHDSNEWLQLKNSCKNDMECLKFDFAICNANQKCQCVNGYVAINENRCRPVVGGWCAKDNDCFVKNSICVKNICTCKPQYTLQSSHCLPTVLEKDCNNDLECSFIHYTECSDENKCICKKGYAVVDKSTCLPLLGSYCVNGERCLAPNSVCENNRCQCKNHFVSVSDHECVLSFLGKKCDTDNDCVEIRLAQCSENKTCTCPSHKISHGHRICLPVLGESCKCNDECASKYAECIDKKCRCKPNYVAISDYECMDSWAYNSYYGL